MKKIVSETDLKHVAIIMDGNRRWAKERHLPSAVGHQKGVEALKKTLRACSDFGIKYLTVYAFSTENWNRKPEEVEFLMSLLAKTLGKELDEMHKEHVKIKFLGDISRLSTTLKEILYDAEEKTKDNTGVNLQIAFNYGSRLEMLSAIKDICKKVKNDELLIDDIDENLISDCLYTSNVPEPDLLIRTGGEYRVSNFLLWQIAYSELLIFDEYWPEFGAEMLKKSVYEFEKRNRRYGK
ncbi:isoprenyl transferase [bacterium]|nr:isoprenyl transferase [bacterium]